MTIALDAMGGDHAPEQILLGALSAIPEIKSTILLIGDPDRIQPLLPNPLPAQLRIYAASQVIEMREKPVEAIRKKRDSSIVVGVDLVAKSEADVFVSAGNTGACTAASLLRWRPMHGFHRPAIASEFPNYHGRFLMLDAGASPDIDPEQIVEFAIMGRAYAKHMMDKPNPRVHLLNMGEEEGKGNAFAKQAYHLLQGHPWFAGNIEGKDMFNQPCDVVVCDAFVGNVTLKTAEGVAEVILKMIRDQVPTGPKRLLYAPMKGLMAPLRKRLDYAEIGGSPLLGLNGLTFISHGRSNARAIHNALLQAERAVQNGLLEALRLGILAELNPPSAPA